MENHLYHKVKSHFRSRRALMELKEEVSTEYQAIEEPETSWLRVVPLSESIASPPQTPESGYVITLDDENMQPSHWDSSHLQLPPLNLQWGPEQDWSFDFPTPSTTAADEAMDWMPSPDVVEADAHVGSAGDQLMDVDDPFAMDIDVDYRNSNDRHNNQSVYHYPSSQICSQASTGGTKLATPILPSNPGVNELTAFINFGDSTFFLPPGMPFASPTSPSGRGPLHAFIPEFILSSKLGITPIIPVNECWPTPVIPLHIAQVQSSGAVETEGTLPLCTSSRSNVESGVPSPCLGDTVDAQWERARSVGMFFKESPFQDTPPGSLDFGRDSTSTPTGPTEQRLTPATLPHENLAHVSRFPGTFDVEEEVPRVSNGNLIPRVSTLLFGW